MKKIETKIKNRILSCQSFDYKYDVGRLHARTYVIYNFSDFRVKVHIVDTEDKTRIDNSGLAPFELLRLKNSQCNISLYVYENKAKVSENDSILSWDEAKHLNNKLKVFVLKDIKSRIQRDNEERQKRDEERQKRDEEIRQNKLECL